MKLKSSTKTILQIALVFVLGAAIILIMQQGNKHYDAETQDTSVYIGRSEI